MGGVPAGVFASPRPSHSFDYTAKGEVVGTALGPGVLIHCYMFAYYFDYMVKGEFAGRAAWWCVSFRYFAPRLGPFRYLSLGRGPVRLG